MSTSNAFWAYGSKMQMGDGATPEVFTTIAEVQDIGGPELSRDEKDVSNQDSTSGWREFLPTWRDGQEVTFDANWLPTNATQNSSTGLLASFNTDTRHNWRLVLPDTTTIVSFAGFITKFAPELPLEDQGKISVTIKVSGAVSVNV